MVGNWSLPDPGDRRRCAPPNGVAVTNQRWAGRIPDHMNGLQRVIQQIRSTVLD
jgi:hypothetical protein